MRLNPSIDEMAKDAWELGSRGGGSGFKNTFARMLAAYGYVIKQWGDVAVTNKGRVTLYNYDIVAV